jgi:HAD superfamily hydrolase (TIGR01549 family)
VPLNAGVEAALEELHAYHRDSNLWEFVPTTVLPALAALRKHGLKITVVSNSNGKLRVLFERLTLVGCVDCMLDSQDEGVEKPDARFFALALERSGARRETTIHVGDLYHVDVVGARNAGLRGVLLDEAGLYPEADCPRVRSLTELVDRIHAGEFD